MFYRIGCEANPNGKDPLRTMSTEGREGVFRTTVCCLARCRVDSIPYEFSIVNVRKAEVRLIGGTFYK